MAIFLPEIIKDNDEILFDVKCSQSLIDMIDTMVENQLCIKLVIL